MSFERFVGKSVIVTGAGSGIGRAVAKRLAAEGATVACLDINGVTAKETAMALGGASFAIEVDVADATAASAAVADAATRLGKLDVLCNIAGIGNFAHSHESTIENFDRMLAVNLSGTYYMSRAAIPHLLETKGNIVNTASTAGFMGQPWSAAYCASKGGVVMLTKALAWEYIKRGIRVNAVAPGGTDTNILPGFAPPEGVEPADAWELMHKMMTPLGMMQPEDMASVFAYVASDESKFMTGSIVVQDGGILS